MLQPPGVTQVWGNKPKCDGIAGLSWGARGAGAEGGEAVRQEAGLRGCMSPALSQAGTGSRLDRRARALRTQPLLLIRDTNVPLGPPSPGQVEERCLTSFWISGQSPRAPKSQKCNLVEPTRSTVFLLFVSPKELVQNVSHRSLTSSGRSSEGRKGKTHDYYSDFHTGRQGSREAATV